MSDSSYKKDNYQTGLNSSKLSSGSYSRGSKVSDSYKELGKSETSIKNGMCWYNNGSGISGSYNGNVISESNSGNGITASYSGNVMSSTYPSSGLSNGLGLYSNGSASYNDVSYSTSGVSRSNSSKVVSSKNKFESIGRISLAGLK